MLNFCSIMVSDRRSTTPAIVVQLLLGMALFGSATPLSKLIGQQFSVFTASCMRMLIACLVLTPIHVAADEKVWQRAAVGLVGNCRDLTVRDGRFYRSHAFRHAPHNGGDWLYNHERDTGSDCRRGRGFLRCRNELADVGSTGPCGRGDSSNQSATNGRRRRHGSSDPRRSSCRNGRVFRSSLHPAFSETVRRYKLAGGHAGSLIDCCVGFCCSGYCFRPPTVRFFRRRSDWVVCGSLLGRGYSGACSCFMV